MFPPLPTTAPSHSVVHSRIASFQSSVSGTTRSNVSTGFERSSTPKIPPGFENVTIHHQRLNDEASAKTTQQLSKDQQKPTLTPVIPVVPSLSNTSSVISLKTSWPKEEREEKKENEQASDEQPDTARTRVVRLPESELRLPKPEVSSKATGKTGDKTQELQQNSLAEVASTVQQKEPEKVLEIDKSSRKSSVKADVPTHADKNSISHKESAGAATTSSTSSKPMTPEPTESKPPVTLRLTTDMINRAQRADNAAPSSTTTEKMSGSQSHTHIGRGSRQASISTSRPSTPAISDHFVSQDVSRSNSPPPSIVTSKGKTKTQLKREKREKVKKAPEVDENTSASSINVTASEPIGPIVARQKKQKKAKVITGQEPPNVQSTGPVKTAEPKKTVFEQESRSQASKDKPSVATRNETSDQEDASQGASPKVDDSRKLPDPPSKPYSLRDFYTEALRMQASAGSSSVDIQRLLSERVSPMSKLLSEMIASGDLSKDHPWFNPTPFSSASYKLPPDHRKGQEYLDGNGYSTNDAFGYVYLPQKEKRALFNGHAVSVADGGDRKNDLLRRCLITPNGWVMRHLNTEESERILDLEERRGLYIEEHGEVGMMAGLGVLEQDDFINLGGGFDELARFGDRHGVCWVVGEREHEQKATEAGGLENDYGLSEVVEESEMIEDGLSDETDEDLDMDLMNAGTVPGAWDPTFSTGTDLPGNTLPPIHGQYGRNVNLRAMDMDALQKRVQEKQKEADSTRKEAEKAEKALGKKAKDHTRWRDSVFKAIEA